MKKDEKLVPVWKKFQKSCERMKKFTKGKRRGFMNWESYHDNFKLECWNIEKNGKVNLVIFQIWPDGNGFSEYHPEKENLNKLEIWIGTYGSYERPCLWMQPTVNGEKGTPTHLELIEMDFEFVYNRDIKSYIDNGYEVKFIKP